jgi:hypothetical protein
MRVLLSATLAALSIVAWPGPARADGISVEKTVTLDELVQTSEAIFTATLLERDVQWASRAPYGKQQRYVVHFRFRIQIGEWLKGTAKPPAQGALWLGYRGDPIPGRWMIVREYYATAFAPLAAKPGSKVVIFAKARDIDSWGNHREQGRAVLHARAVDTADRLPAVRAALARPPAPPDASPDR